MLLIEKFTLLEDDNEKFKGLPDNIKGYLYSGDYKSAYNAVKAEDENSNKKLIKVIQHTKNDDKNIEGYLIHKDGKGIDNMRYFDVLKVTEKPQIIDALNNNKITLFNPNEANIIVNKLNQNYNKHKKDKERLTLTIENYSDYINKEIGIKEQIINMFLAKVFGEDNVEKFNEIKSTLVKLLLELDFNESNPFIVYLQSYMQQNNANFMSKNHFNILNNLYAKGTLEDKHLIGDNDVRDFLLREDLFTIKPDDMRFLLQTYIWFDNEYKVRKHVVNPEIINTYKTGTTKGIKALRDATIFDNGKLRPASEVVKLLNKYADDSDVESDEIEDVSQPAGKGKTNILRYPSKPKQDARWSNIKDIEKFTEEDIADLVSYWRAITTD